MFLIYSRHFTKSPLKVAQALDLEAIEHHAVNHRHWRAGHYNLDNTFFTYYPEPSHDFEDYQTVWQFAAGNKFSQREAMAAHGIPVPATRRHPRANWSQARLFIVRPLTHAKQQGIRMTNDQLDCGSGEYIAEFLDVKKEFRTLFCAGQPVVTMFKRDANTENESYELTRLDRFGFLDRLSTFPPIRNASLVGVDLVMTADGRGHALECNFAPMLYPKNVERVARIWANRR